MNPVVRSKSVCGMPDGIYVGNVSGWVLTILSQYQFGREIPLEFGVKTMSLAVVVLVKGGIANCFDKGFKLW